MSLRVHPRSRQMSLRSRLSKLTYLMVVILLLLCQGSTARAGLPNYRLCFPDVISTPDTFLQPPNIDGIVVGDNGWTSSFRYVFQNGTPNSNVVVQGIKDANFIYLSFEVNADPSFDVADMIVLAFDPDGTTANQSRLHIFPLFTTGAGAGGAPAIVEYWKDSATWGGASQSLPAGTLIRVTSAGAGPVAWNVEVKLPTNSAGLGLPTASPFGFYFNTLVFDNVGIVGERHWPLSPDSPDISLFPNNTPPASTWGMGDFSGGCNGVSISPSDITTNQNPTSKIALNAGNIFSVLVHNNSTNSLGAAIPATQVDATFKIANFGIGNQWALVPAPGNPTSGATTIPTNSTSTISTGTWNLTPGQVTQYTANDHQCILVELDSPAANTTFVNKSAWRNMDFGNASVFERPAEISGKGYEPPPDGGDFYDFDLVVTTEEERSIPRGTSKVAAATNQPIAQLTYIVHGYRHTGRYIESFRRRYEIVEPVGAFGYIVQHAGEVKNWVSELTGNGLQKTAENRYRLKVPKNGAATVKTTIEAVEPGVVTPPGFKRWGLSLHAGVSIPQGNFNTFFNPGPNAGVDLEYRINPTFSLEGIYTFHRFNGETFGSVSVGDLNLHQFSFNGKVYGSSSPVRPFFNFGGGAYRFDPGSTNGGLNVGGGFQFDVAPNVAMDAMYNFHNVFTSGSSTRFSTLQGGVRFRF
jgi:opacity protein-like surface antigen